MSALQVLYEEVKDELESIRKLLVEAKEIKQKEASNVNIRAGGSISDIFSERYMASTLSGQISKVC